MVLNDFLVYHFLILIFMNFNFYWFFRYKAYKKGLYKSIFKRYSLRFRTHKEHKISLVELTPEDLFERYRHWAIAKKIWFLNKLILIMLVAIGPLFVLKGAPIFADLCVLALSEIFVTFIHENTLFYERYCNFVKIFIIFNDRVKIQFFKLYYYINGYNFSLQQVFFIRRKKILVELVLRHKLLRKFTFEQRIEYYLKEYNLLIYLAPCDIFQVQRYVIIQEEMFQTAYLYNDYHDLIWYFANEKKWRGWPLY